MYTGLPLNTRLEKKQVIEVEATTELQKQLGLVRGGVFICMERCVCWVKYCCADIVSGSKSGHGNPLQPNTLSNEYFLLDVRFGLFLQKHCFPGRLLFLSFSESLTWKIPNKYIWGGVFRILLDWTQQAHSSNPMWPMSFKVDDIWTLAGHTQKAVERGWHWSNPSPNHRIKTCQQHQKQEKVLPSSFSLRAPEGSNLANTVLSAPGFQDHESIHFCCFQLYYLWSPVYES